MPTRDLAKLSEGIWRKLERIESATEREILANYRVVLEDIRKELGRVFEKYSQGGMLSLAEMTRYNRLTTLERQLIEIMGPALSKNGKLTSRLVEAEYQESFFRHGWMIEQNAGVALKWGLLSEATIKAAATNPLAALAKTGLKQEALTGIRRVLLQGLTAGTSYPQMARDMKKFVERNASGYLRIAQTEAHKAMVQGQLDNYAKAEELGIVLNRVWVATLDDRTRPSHADMDGKEAGEDGLFDTPWGAVEGPGEGPAEEVINCRCRVISEIEGFEPTVQRVRDEGLQPVQTYNEWASERGITENRYGAKILG